MNKIRRYLGDFFRKYFDDADDLRRLVRHLPCGDQMYRSLPGEIASTEVVVDKTISVITSHEIHRSPDFWSQLKAARPALAPHIETLRERLLRADRDEVRQPPARGSVGATSVALVRPPSGALAELAELRQQIDVAQRSLHTTALLDDVGRQATETVMLTGAKALTNLLGAGQSGVTPMARKAIQGMTKAQKQQASARSRRVALRHVDLLEGILRKHASDVDQRQRTSWLRAAERIREKKRAATIYENLTDLIDRIGRALS